MQKKNRITCGTTTGTNLLIYKENENLNIKKSDLPIKGQKITGQISFWLHESPQLTREQFEKLYYGEWPKED